MAKALSKRHALIVLEHMRECLDTAREGASPYEPGERTMYMAWCRLAGRLESWGDVPWQDDSELTSLPLRRDDDER